MPPKHACVKEDDIKHLLDEQKNLKNELDNSFDQLEHIRSTIQNLFEHLTSINQQILNQQKENLRKTNEELITATQHYVTTRDSQQKVIIKDDSKYDIKNILFRLITILVIISSVGLGLGLFWLLVSNPEAFTAIIKGLFSK